jgi:hypothetical protein
MTSNNCTSAEDHDKDVWTVCFCGWDKRFLAEVWKYGTGKLKPEERYH